MREMELFFEVRVLISRKFDTEQLKRCCSSAQSAAVGTSFTESKTQHWGALIEWLISAS